MKKQYVKPFMAIEDFETEQLLTSSIIGIESGDVGISYGGSGSGPARSRELDDFVDGIDELNSQLGRLLLIGE